MAFLRLSDAPVNIVASISEEFGLPAMSQMLLLFVQISIFKENYSEKTNPDTILFIYVIKVQN